jgi:hypothetical protein
MAVQAEYVEARQRQIAQARALLRGEAVAS